MMINYLYFCLTFLICAVIFCGTFLFCSRVFYIQKVEKLEPVNNVFKSEEKRTVKKRLDREEAIERLLENG